MKIVPDAPGAFLKRSFSRFARALHTGQYTFSVSNIADPFCIWILGGSPPPYPTIMEESMASRKRQEPRMGIEPTTFSLRVRCSTIEPHQQRTFRILAHGGDKVKQKML